MEPRTIARALAAGRVGFGVAFLAAPAAVAAPWIGRDARRTGTKVMIRALGARDLVLGAGLLSALSTGGAKPWIVAAAGADAGDLAATLRARGEIPTTGLVSLTLIAGAATAAGAWLSAQGDW